MIVQFSEKILQNFSLHKTNPICTINDESCDYGAFGEITGGIQNKIHRTGSPVIGILTQNHAHTYATIIATWLMGKAYVPINASYPAERLRTIFTEAGITDIFYSVENAETEALRIEFGDIQFHCTTTFSSAVPFNTFPSKDKTAYILFTSGTTGKPKGVPITFGNLEAFLDSFNQLGYDLGSNDRFLQMFELTFDLSVMSFMVPMTLGASFYTLPSGMIKTLGLYQVLDTYEISFSLMVPSAINLLKPYLDDVDLPHLRYSQFCGEALKADLVSQWSRCIPNARIDNVYGPTEATIYCTCKTLDIAHIEEDSLNGVAGIGVAMANVETFIADTENNPVNTDEVGELCLAGAQLTPGYLNNPEQNEKAFFEKNGTRYYRTGDLVKANTNGEIFYAGRKDDQVKIQGFRIELAELELAATRILPAHSSVAVGFQDHGGNWMLALFIQNLMADSEIIRTELGQHIPDYMIPHLVMSIDDFPLNSNGKTDKKILRQLALNHL